ncbi:MAG: DUF308 domain-containing protein [Bacteroidales bacterium]|nr:DUF308 domain-containing protein [Bacteroidales bacterium]
MKRHFENLTKRAGRAIQHWWLLAVAGILSIAAGIAVFVFPLEGYVVLSILFGVLMLVVGAAQLIIAATSGNYLMMKGYVIVGGILDLLMGIFLCVYPGVTLVLLPIMLGIWMMYHSFMIIAFGSDLDTFKFQGSGWVICGGVLLLMLSVAVLLNPFSAGIATVILIAGVGLIVFGILLCAMSAKLKDIHKAIQSISPAE